MKKVLCTAISLMFLLKAGWVNGQCTPLNDSLALVSLYNATNGPSWTNHTNWLVPGQSIDNWYGVILHPNGCVLCLDLDGTDDCLNTSGASGNNLNGSLPDLNLPALEFLYLSSNNLSGNIPNFSNLDNLTNFSCKSNNLTGGIPNFANTPLLSLFDCSDNGLTGSIPNFTNLSGLAYFYCSNNGLTGGIPNFNGTSNLTEFSCSFNSLGGVLPSFSNLTALTQFFCSHTNLGGSIPDYSFLPLAAFWCNNNDLSGCYPANVCSITNFNSANNPKLPWQGDHTNFCNGDPQIGAPCNDGNSGTSGEEILADCSCAVFYCTHPDKPALLELYEATGGNAWTNQWDTTSCDVCNWYGVDCDANGRVFRIELPSNNLTGSIANLTNLSLPFLEQFILNNNNITGGIPNFSDLPNIEILNLGSNQLTGTIPNFNLPSLTELNLFFNPSLTGNIPNFNLPNLINLMLGNSSLSGPIPNFNLPNLRYLTIAQSTVSGNIPNFNLPNLISLGLFTNNLSGNIPNFNLPNLTTLNLSQNQLSGNIPNLNLPSLLQFAAANNDLSGTIPVINAPSLWQVTIFNNNLHGCFPSYVCNLSLFSATGNPQLPWQGDHTNFCNGDPQEGAPCDDGNSGTTGEEILADCSCAVFNCTHPDKPALIELYEATGGDAWLNVSWDTTTCDVCNWDSVLCNGNGRV